MEKTKEIKENDTIKSFHSRRMKREVNKQNRQNQAVNVHSLKNKTRKGDQYQKPVNIDSLDDEISNIHQNLKTTKYQYDTSQTLENPQQNNNTQQENQNVFRYSNEDPTRIRSREHSNEIYKSVSRKVDDKQPADDNKKQNHTENIFYDKNPKYSNEPLKTNLNLPPFKNIDNDYRESIEVELKEDLAKQIELNRRRNVIMKKEQEFLDELYEKKYLKELNDIKSSPRQPITNHDRIIQTDYTKKLVQQKTFEENSKTYEIEKQLEEDGGNPFITRNKLNYSLTEFPKETPDTNTIQYNNTNPSNYQQKYTNYNLGMNSPIEEISEETQSANMNENLTKSFSGINPPINNPQNRYNNYNELDNAEYMPYNNETNNNNVHEEFQNDINKNDYEKNYYENNQNSYRSNFEKPIHHDHRASIQYMHQEMEERKNYFNYFDMDDDINNDMQYNELDKENKSYTDNQNVNQYANPIHSRKNTQDEKNKHYRYFDLENYKPEAKINKDYNELLVEKTPQKSNAMKNLEELSKLIKRQKHQFKSELESLTLSCNLKKGHYYSPSEPKIYTGKSNILFKKSYDNSNNIFSNNHLTRNVVRNEILNYNRRDRSFLLQSESVNLAYKPSNDIKLDTGYELDRIISEVKNNH